MASATGTISAGRAVSSCGWTGRAGKGSGKQRPARVSMLGDFSHFCEVVKKDVSFIGKKVGRGMEWANEAFHVPVVKKFVDDVVWLRVLEKPGYVVAEDDAAAVPWPQFSYPELTGIDLLMADLKAFQAYSSYFYSLSKMWEKPLPGAYNPEGVADYFSCRPHIVAFRLIEIFSFFVTASIKIRMASLTNFFGSNRDVDTGSTLFQHNFGLVLKETLLNLGPTFIKVGQSLSTRPDIIGSEISKALSELHDQIPPFPRTLAMKIIEEEFGSPVEAVFSYISEEPVAAASFGQVYYAKTPDGCDVAVKVQRPDLHHIVVRDIYILSLGLGLVQKIYKRKNDPRLYADELGKGFVGELDYRLEAANAVQFLETHSSFSFMYVPKVYEQLTRKRVLTMEWMVGESPTELLSISSPESILQGSIYSEKQICDAKRRLLDLVNKGVEATLIQLLETGLLHADPHPGNLRYTSSGQIGFLDFGLLCRMERRHQLAMLASIVHIVNGDWPSLVQALTEMDVIKPGINLQRVTMDLENALGEVEFRNGIPDVKFSRVLGKIWSVALKYHFRMPPYYTLVLRSLASLEGLALAADRNFKTFQAAYPYVVRKLLMENTLETRRILYPVVFNKKKEFRWERLSLFLRVGISQQNMEPLAARKDGDTFEVVSRRKTRVMNVADLVLKLLPSRQGVVIRRLLMTADGASLVRAMVSKEAVFYRQQLSQIIADIIFQWMCRISGNGDGAAQYSSQLAAMEGEGENADYQAMWKDRRLRVIFFKAVRSAQKDPMLMLRFYWSAFTILLAASALACRRVMVSFAEFHLRSTSFSPKRLAINT
ncbi:hypothetical protein MLD38_038094 [Melastoma candidum]|uniref:Uncharacterized protein n=2 Tax=Melastoma candidum TaxID=119954 RepID=A0ACB9KY31_9MYRT|nr:hypothetical protein MLD38_038094 [Melastoma candidum]